MKKLIIHAGTYKTGSTSLQLFLFDNERLLAEKGLGVFRPQWAYPISPDDPRNIGLEHTASFLRRHFYSIEKEGYRDYSPSLQKKIFESDKRNIEDFKQFLQRHDNVIISGEGLYEASKPFWEFVRKYSTELGIEQLLVIVYLRRQNALLSSMYRQYIQARNPLERINEAHVRKSNFLDYDRCISNIESSLGHESVIVRQYDRKHLVGGDVRRDFCDAIGYGWDERFVLRDNVNPSISFDVAEAKQVVNLSPTYLASDDFMYAASEQASKVVCDRPHESLLSTEEARSMMALYEEGNRAISERFFGGEPLFDEVEDGIIGWERDSNRVLDAGIVLLTEALAEQRQQLAVQKRRVDRLEKLLFIPQLRKAKHWLKSLHKKR